MKYYYENYAGHLTPIDKQRYYTIARRKGARTKVMINGGKVSGHIVKES